jgi:hypothetical protein
MTLDTPKAGDRCLFRSSASLGSDGPVISRYDRHTCEVVRPCTAEEVDLEEVGPMFVVRFDDGHEDDAFIDELEVIA